MFKPAIRLSPQDFDAINSRMEHGTRLGDYMAGDMNARDAEINYVSRLSEDSLFFYGHLRLLAMTMGPWSLFFLACCEIKLQ